MFGNILNYFNSTGTAAPTQKSSLQKINAEIEFLEKKRSFLQKKVDDLGEQIKCAAKKKNQREARLFMNRRLEAEKQVGMLDQSIMNLERIAQSLDTQSINEVVAKSMAVGTKEMKKAQGNVTVKSVDDIVLDANEAMENVAELSQSISQPIGNVPSNEELDNKLAEFLEEDQADESTTAAPAPASSASSSTAVENAKSYPSAPETRLDDQDIEEALAELAAEMAT